MHGISSNTLPRRVQEQVFDQFVFRVDHSVTNSNDVYVHNFVYLPNTLFTGGAFATMGNAGNARHLQSGLNIEF